MKLLLRLAVRGAVVSSLLLLGCSQGHRTSTAPPIAVIASPTRLVASQPPPLTHPPIHIIAVSPVGAAEEQETAMIAMPVQPNSAPPLIVRGACADEPNAVVPFGHAPDYRWLSGELRYSPVRGAWCLHYAPCEEQDCHGGSVTLIGAEGLAVLRTGQTLRVEGEMIDPQSREPSPAYRVRRLRVLPNG